MARYSDRMVEAGGLATGGRIFAGRYEEVALVERRLGVDTYRGRDLQTGADVLVKELPAGDLPAGAELRIAHDAAALRRVGCRGLVAPLEVGRDGDRFHVVRAFVAGETLAERLASGPLPPAEAVAVGRALLGALGAAHEAGVLHRGLHPRNVVLSREGPGAAVAVDFGLARSAGAWRRDGDADALAHLSPEQLGLVACEVGERSDLYAAGAILFRCVTGAAPYGRADADGLRRRLGAPPPDPSLLRHDIPAALSSFARHLLETDPRERYQSAAAALSDLDRIAAALESGIGDPALELGAPDRRRALTEPAFVGRAEELRAFEHELARASSGASSLVVVEGESGAGKTSLLDRAALCALERGGWVLRARGTGGVAPRPLGLVEEVIGQVAAAVRADPELRDRLRTRACDHLEALCVAFPQLTGLLAPGMLVSLGPEAHGEARTLPAVVALLDALGTPGRPGVVLLDDCQWADELSLKIVAAWARPRARSEHGGVIVVAAYRRDELPPESPLRAAPAARHLAVDAFAPPDVRRMAESMAGALPPGAVELVARLSEGNPFLAAAALQGLVEGGALVDTPRGWQLSADAAAGPEGSTRAAAFVADRLAKAPPAVRQLLSAGAILGRCFELGAAADLAALGADEAMEAVREARRRRLVWIDAVGSGCTFVHDRLRDAVLEALDATARRRLHRAAATRLEQAEAPDPERAFDLAYHWDAADEPARALPHALAAASRARARHALELAERYYRMAARGADAPGVPGDTRLELAEGLGDVLLLRGRYDEAAAWLARARELAASPVARAQIEGKLGELAFKRGDVRAAAGAIERALRILGRRVPRRLATVVLATVVQVAIQLAHTLLPRRLVARGQLEAGEADLLAARLYSRLAYAYWFLRGQGATFWAHLSGLNLAERYPPTRELAQACSEHAISVTGLPRIFFRRGLRYADRGLAIRRALGDVWGEGQSRNFHGMLLYSSGRYRDALATFREALALLRRTGDRWEANIAGIHIAFCHYRLGALGEAVAECRRVHREGVEIGDGHAVAVVLEVWAKATGGAVPPELLEAALRSSAGDPQTHETVLQACGVRAIAEGRFGDAVRAFAEAERTARAVNLRSEYVSYLPLWLARARRLEVTRALAEGGALVRPRLREAERAMRSGLRNARRYRGNLPMALRERASLRAMRGRVEAARRDLDASLAEAERQGARFEAAQTLLARGELGSATGVAGAAAEADRARAALREMGAEFACSRPDWAAPHACPATAQIEEMARRLDEADEGLAQAAKMATLGTLAAGLVHELNNPLATIIGFAQLHLKRLSPDDPVRSSMDAIERQARRCAELIRTLLDFSRKGPGERADVALDGVLCRVVSMASLKRQRHQVELDLALPPEGTYAIRVSGTQIESALLNVVDNAIDAAPRGSAVRLEASPCERDGRPGVEIRVHDDGPGIEPEVLARIFDPFYTTKPPGQGTGLGLPLARRFVQEHEGALTVESRPGEGTTVRVWLPLAS